LPESGLRGCHATPRDRSSKVPPCISDTRPAHPDGER
jgi:hypothetical protein